MSLSISLPTGIAAKYTRIEVWMERAVNLSSRIRPDWDSDEIHDLRVALRRSRTMAEALNEVNPAPGWKKIKKSSRELFHALGGLRDSQVEKSWIKKLGNPGDPCENACSTCSRNRKGKHRKFASQALDDFDRKDWRRWSCKLSAKARFFPLESVVYQRLALARLNKPSTSTSAPARNRAAPHGTACEWHQTFRYIVENFLPQRYEVWAEDLKHMQDLLGDVHDLDVLRSEIRKNASMLTPAGTAQWLATIRSERKARLDEFLAKASAKDSPWVVWRADFQWGHALVAAPSPQRRTA